MQPGTGRPGAGPPDVVVVVVTYNSARVLPGLLDSLPEGLSGLSSRVVVVDNGSVDDSVAVAGASQSVASVVATGRNGGYAAGINAGVRAAGPARAVLVLNPDVRLGPGCAARLLSALEASGAGIVAPRLEDAAGVLICSRRREPTLGRAVADLLLGAERAGRIGRLGEVETDAEAYEVEGWADWVEGSTLMIGWPCWQTVGAWDESYFLYSEETDYALRARDAGMPARFVPSARAVHLEGGSAADPGLWRLLVANKLRLYSRRHNPGAAALFWTLLVLREASRAALGRRTSRAALKGLSSPRYLRARPGPHSVVSAVS